MKNIQRYIVMFACVLGITFSVNGQTILLSTTNSYHGSDWNIGSGYFSIGQQFTTGSQSESIASVSLFTGNLYGSGDPLTLSFYIDAAGAPGSLVSDGSLTGPGSLLSDTVNTFTASGLTLSANTTYWLVFDDTSTDVQVQNRQGGSLVTTSSTGWTLGNFGYKTEGSAGAYSFAYNGIAEPLFTITSTVAVPEPGSFTMISLGLVGLLFMRRRI